MDFTFTDEINYTLAGYFMKVANMIILAKPLESLKYIFTHKDILTNMKKHIYSKSVSSLLMFILNTRKDTLNKVVTSTNPENFFKEFNKDRIELIEELFLDCAKYAGSREHLETHLSSAIIVNHTLQNIETIADGQDIVEKLFETDKIIQALVDQTQADAGTTMGNVSQVLGHIIDISKENTTDLEKTICK